MSVKLPHESETDGGDKVLQPAAGGRGDRHIVIDADEKVLVRKLDFFIIPLIMTLYLFSFLDRFVVSPIQFTDLLSAG